MAKNESKAPDPVESEIRRVKEALAMPFDSGDVKWKPQTISGSRALMVAYVDARAIQDRLDEVVGVEGWQDRYECLPDGAVVCRLRVKLGDRWITKEDVGGQSEQPDEGDRRKAAFSDALKRASVKFGIGRYLYRLEAQWVDYDPQKKRVVGTPRLPAHAVPPSASVKERPSAKSKPPAPAAAQAAAKGLPANGEELHKRLDERDRQLAEQNRCKRGDLVKHVVDAGIKKGFEKDMAAWSGEAIAFATEKTREFLSQVTSAPAQAA